MTLGDRLVVMDGGVVQQVDTPTRIYQNPVNRFVAGFVGTPAMNFIEGSLESGGGFLVGDSRLSLGNGFDHVPSGDAVLGVRPSALFPSESGRGLECRIVAVENLGDRADLVLESGGRQLVSRVPACNGFREGSILWVEPGSGEGVHLFEPGERGRNLTAP